MSLVPNPECPLLTRLCLCNLQEENDRLSGRVAAPQQKQQELPAEVAPRQSSSLRHRASCGKPASSSSTKAQAAAGQVLTQPPEAQPSLRSATDRFDDSGLGEGDDDEDLLLGGGLDALSLAAAAAGGGGASQQLTKQG